MRVEAATWALAGQCVMTLTLHGLLYLLLMQIPGVARAVCRVRQWQREHDVSDYCAAASGDAATDTEGCMMQALPLDELMDIGDEQYERLVVEPAVAAIRIRERAKLLREYMPVLRAIYKCGGRADADDVAEETGMMVSRADVAALRPWLRGDGDQLWLTTVGQSVMRREMVSDEQH